MATAGTGKHQKKASHQERQKTCDLAKDSTPSKIFFDLETTGLGRTSHITQLAAVRGKDRFSRYIMPKIPIHPAASKVTGITVRNNKMYYNKEEVDTVSINNGLEQFIGFLADTSNNILLGHNIHQFDCPILINALISCNKIEMFFDHVTEFLDTLKFFRISHPGQKSYKQVSLVKSLMGDNYEAHDALEDVLALQKLFNHVSTNMEAEAKASLTAEQIMKSHKSKLDNAEKSLSDALSKVHI